MKSCLPLFCGPTERVVDSKQAEPDNTVKTVLFRKPQFFHRRPFLQAIQIDGYNPSSLKTLSETPVLGFSRGKTVNNSEKFAARPEIYVITRMF